MVGGFFLNGYGKNQAAHHRGKHLYEKNDPAGGFPLARRGRHEPGPPRSAHSTRSAFNTQIQGDKVRDRCTPSAARTTGSTCTACTAGKTCQAVRNIRDKQTGCTAHAAGTAGAR